MKRNLSSNDLFINTVLYKICQKGSRREGSEEFIELIEQFRSKEFDTNYDEISVARDVLASQSNSFTLEIELLNKILRPFTEIDHSSLAAFIYEVMAAALISIHKLYAGRHIDAVSLMTYLTGQKGRLREQLPNSFINKMKRPEVIQFMKEDNSSLNRSHRALKRLKGLISA